MIVKGCKWFLFLEILEELTFVLDSTLASFDVIESLHLWRSQRTFASVVLAPRKITKSIRTFYSVQLLCTHCRACVMKSHVTCEYWNMTLLISSTLFDIVDFTIVNIDWLHQMYHVSAFLRTFQLTPFVPLVPLIPFVPAPIPFVSLVPFDTLDPLLLWNLSSILWKKGQRWKWTLSWSNDRIYKKNERFLTLGVKASGRRTLRFVTWWVENTTQCFFRNVSKDVH